MRQIILEIEDSAYEQFMGMVGLCPSVKVVCESGITDVMNDRDQCMVYAIQTLRNNHVFRFGYDYTWIMMAINEGLVDDYEGFKSPQAFLDYLYEIGIEKLPSRITLSLAYSKTFDRFPDRLRQLRILRALDLKAVRAGLEDMFPDLIRIGDAAALP